jgi:hypothetical protein
VLGAAALFVVFLRQGRYCDSHIGAIGHPYFQFIDGKVYVVACGERTLEATYRWTANGWEATPIPSKGVTNTSPIEFHWWGVVAGQPPDQTTFHRCWHFWMNSHGPLWNPWDR